MKTGNRVWLLIFFLFSIPALSANDRSFREVCIDLIYGGRSHSTLPINDVNQVARMLEMSRRWVSYVKEKHGLEVLREPYELALAVYSANPYFFRVLSQNLNDLRYNPNLPTRYRIFRPRYWPAIGHLFSTREAALANALTASYVEVTRSQFRLLMKVVDTLPAPVHMTTPSDLFDRANQICVNRAKENFSKVKGDLRDLLKSRNLDAENLTEQSLLRDMQELVQTFLNQTEGDIFFLMSMARLYGSVNGLMSPTSVQYTWNHTRNPRTEKLLKKMVVFFLNANNVKGNKIRPVYEALLEDAFFGLTDHAATALSPEAIRTAFTRAVQSQVDLIANQEQFQLPEQKVQIFQNAGSPPSATSNSNPIAPRVIAPQNFRTRQRTKVITEEPAPESPLVNPPRPLEQFQIDYLRRGTWRDALRNPRAVKHREYVAVCNSLLGDYRTRCGHFIYQTPFNDTPIFVVAIPNRTEMSMSYVINLRRLINRFALEYPELEIEPETW